MRSVYGRDSWWEVYDLWDQLALTPAEDDVVRALAAIDVDVERVSAVGQGRCRSFTVRLRGGSVRPLRSLGDGLGRVLHAAAAVASGNVALIDEIDAGVHYSRQADLWRVLFRLAERTGTQVIATTHSLDAVRGFSTAASESPLEGQLLLLERLVDHTRAVVLDEPALQVATTNDIEVR